MQLMLKKQGMAIREVITHSDATMISARTNSIICQNATQQTLV